MRKPSPMVPAARSIAANTLTAVLERRRPLEEAWDKDAYSMLAARDKGFAQLLVKTTLRRLRQTDALLNIYLSKPLPPQAGTVGQHLRLGIVQLLWLETPPHAAVNEAVEAVRGQGYAPYAGLVNAVLKRAARDGKADMEKMPAVNLPDWLWQGWQSAYGREEAAAIAEALTAEPPLDITVKSGAETWANRLRGEVTAPYSVRLNEYGQVMELEGFAEGEWWVQDIAASLPVTLLGGVRGLCVLDMCAAPGGKTAQLACAGAKVTALDRSEKRLRLVDENLSRLRLAAECIAVDAALYRPDAPPDAVLLDAPCSATGTLRRHPDVAWHRTPADIVRLADIQRKLLHHALDIVKPGGLVAYAVCSLEPLEGERQIEALLNERRDVKLCDAPAASPMHRLARKTPHGWRTLPSFLPEQGGMDGFFMACIQKI